MPPASRAGPGPASSASPQTPSGETRRSKLGLALSGGGFRAALFHLGVLRRLAELDLLRRVEVVSTVSGGSLVGGLYALLVKREMERSAELTRRDYLDLVDELIRRTKAGIRKNLRARLLLNPVALIRMVAPAGGLGRRAARLYGRHFFAPVVRQLDGVSPPLPGWIARLGDDGRSRGGRPGVGGRARQLAARVCRAIHRRLRAGSISLRDIRIRPGGRRIRGDLESYNRTQLRRIRRGEPAAVIPRLVVNATSLNSGARFWFSAVEAGDGDLGHLRPDESEELLDRKLLLEDRVGEVAAVDGRPFDGTLDDLVDALRNGPESAPAVRLRRSASPLRTAALALWWRRGRRPDLPGAWSVLADHLPRLPSALAGAEMGRLREAKLPAWYLRFGPVAGSTRDGGAPGGRPAREHWRRLLATLEEIDPRLPPRAVARLEHHPDPRRRRARSRLLLDFILEVYWIRTAARASHGLRADWRRLTLGDAVGASAAFPPVFAPVVVRGLYDDRHVSRLTLTDGGVFDNMGVAALLHAGCEAVVASDAGRRFRRRRRGAAGRLSGATRSLAVLRNAVAGAQREAMRERRRVSRAVTHLLAVPPSSREVERDLRFFLARRRLAGLAYFHLGSPPRHPERRADAGSGTTGPPPPSPDLDVDPERLAAIRTDLDAFGEVEAATLVNRGYQVADQYVRTYLPDLVSDAGAGRDAGGSRPRLPEPVVPRERSARILREARWRLFRPLRLSWRAHRTAVETAAVAVALVAGSGLAVAGQSSGWTGAGLVSAAVGAALAAAALAVAVLLGAVGLGAFWLLSGRLYRRMTRIAPGKRSADAAGRRSGGRRAEPRVGLGFRPRR